MSRDRSSSDDTDGQSERERWELAHALTPDCDVTLNNEYTNLTVSHIRPNADGGDITEVTLLNDDHDTFVLHVTNGDPSIPVLTIPENEQIPVTSITAPSNGLLSQTTARELYGSAITDVNVDPTDTYPDDRNPTPSLEATDLTVIGECPKCDCIVAAQDNRAICTGCGTWTPRDQWDAYYDTDAAPDTTTGDADSLTQQTLKEAWPTDPDPAT